MIDELPKTTGVSTVEGECQTREIFQAWFIDFLRERRSLFEGALRQHVAELPLDLLDLRRGQRSFQSDHELTAYES